MPDKILFPNETIIKTELFDARQDWETPIPGFFIVASVRKIKSVADFTNKEASEFIRLVCKLRQGMKEALGINDVYLFQNEQTSHHDFHLWIFPRYQWMEQFGRKIESVRPIINYAKENMQNESIFAEVRDCVQKMREYMKF